LASNPTRTGVIEILRRMAPTSKSGPSAGSVPRPVADIRVRAGAGRHRDRQALVTAAIDEFRRFSSPPPARAAPPNSRAEELRVKESDRIQAMCEGLWELGVAAQPRPDGAGSSRPAARRVCR